MRGSGFPAELVVFVNGNCPFCKIAAHEIPAAILYEDDAVVGFRDLNPQAPVHVLLIPRRHVPSLDALRPEDGDLIAALVLAGAKVARDQDLAEDGYRVVANCGEQGGQSVSHLHLHLLGGRHMTWPPG